MIRLVRAELAKLQGSLALLFALIVPMLPAILCVMALMTRDRPPAWSQMLDQFILPLWLLFMLPMVIAALATLLAQIEYKARAWDQVFSLPYPRWQIICAKSVVLVLALAIMSLLLAGYTYVLGYGAGTISGNMPTGPMDPGGFSARILTVSGAAAFLCAIQLWAALRFGNFVVPLAIGIGGTMVALAVAMTGTRSADWFPWVLPFRTIDPASGSQPVIIGLTGGLIVFAMMVTDLSKRLPR